MIERRPVKRPWRQLTKTARLSFIQSALYVISGVLLLTGAVLSGRVHIVILLVGGFFLLAGAFYLVAAIIHRQHDRLSRAPGPDCNSPFVTRWWIAS
jgi:uncharacterized membrane protein HdeD (DUF308 family)